MVGNNTGVVEVDCVVVAITGTTGAGVGAMEPSPPPPPLGAGGAGTGTVMVNVRFFEIVSPAMNPAYVTAAVPEVSAPPLNPDATTLNVNSPVPSATTSFCFEGS